MTGAVTARYCDVESALAEYGTRWRELADATGDATLFMRPSVFAAWHRVIGKDITSSVIIVERDGGFCGVLPVMRATNWRGPSLVPRIDYAPYDRELAPGGHRVFPVRQLSSVVSWRASSLRPTTLCAPTDRAPVFGAIAKLMAETRHIDQIVLPILDGEEEVLWLDAFRAAGLQPGMHRLERALNTLETARPFEQILADSSHNFRRSLRRARKAAAQAGLGFELYQGRRAITSQMETFAEIAAQSWKSEKNAKESSRIGLAFEGVQRANLEHILAAGDPGLTPLLSVGRIGDVAISASLFLCHGKTATGLLTFRTPQLASASPGVLAMIPGIDWAAAHGLKRIDMNATQDWMRYLTDTRRVLSNVVCFRNTPRGYLYRRIAQSRGLVQWQGPIG